MNFLELLQALEGRLGFQHLPLNPRATTLKRIFDGSPVHHDLMLRLVQALYYANGCERLTDAVERGASFDAVGPVRQDALRVATTDVDVCRLLDDFCNALNEIFPTEPTRPTTPTTAGQRQAEVIGFDTAKRRQRKPH